MEEQTEYLNNPLSQDRVKDLEEKNRNLKDRIILIGKNLVDLKQKNNQELLEIKQEIEKIKQSMQKLIRFLELASVELSKTAKKEDLEILKKQAKMFQPLEFVKKQELKGLIK